MNLPSAIFSKKLMEIRQILFVPEIREARSCLKREFVASTCSKWLERASQDGFLVGKQHEPPPK